MQHLSGIIVRTWEKTRQKTRKKSKGEALGKEKAVKNSMDEIHPDRRQKETEDKKAYTKSRDPLKHPHLKNVVLSYDLN